MRSILKAVWRKDHQQMIVKKLANDLQKVFRQSGWNVASVAVSVDEDDSGYAYGIINKFKYRYHVDVKI